VGPRVTSHADCVHQTDCVSKGSELLASYSIEFVRSLKEEMHKSIRLLTTSQLSFILCTKIETCNSDLSYIPSVKGSYHSAGTVPCHARVQAKFLEGWITAYRLFVLWRMRFIT